MTYHFPALQVPEPRLTYIYKESVRLVLLTKIGHRQTPSGSE